MKKLAQVVLCLGVVITASGLLFFRETKSSVIPKATHQSRQKSTIKDDIQLKIEINDKKSKSGNDEIAIAKPTTSSSLNKTQYTWVYRKNFINVNTAQCIEEISKISDPSVQMNALSIVIQEYKGDLNKLISVLFPNVIHEDCVFDTFHLIGKKTSSLPEFLKLYSDTYDLLNKNIEKNHINAVCSLILFHQNKELAKEWLLDLPDDEAEQADNQAFSVLDSNPSTSIEILQKLLDGDKISRFKECAANFVYRYKSTDSTACLNWTLSLPENTPSRQELIRSAFVQVCANDSQLALELQKNHKELSQINISSLLKSLELIQKK